MVGIGPGSIDEISPRALTALKASECIVGYKTYLHLIRNIIGDKKTIQSGMGKEEERCTAALAEACRGKIVSIVSSGDPGVYGMAGLILEIISKSPVKIPIEIIPGITAASAASSLLGAPLGHDHAVISLSDLLTPWEIIEKRLKLAAEGDFIVVLYNPKSTQRTWQIEKTREIFLNYKLPNTPVGIVRNARREGESITITTLGKMLDHHIDMTTLVIIGNSDTFVFNSFMVTRRGY
ncbi:MAG TPA: precorrin-3B C(17)-methyltransferase [Candidatus Brocadiia bacterium]|nr:precorrin-3B C(17)-methyltransferase [Candidatus Brocadiales bacterium]